MGRLISIIVPCFNQGRFLREALQSVSNQTYKDWECIIVNDGSTDNTELIANEWVAKDDRFIYISQKNRGLSGARNMGLQTARGSFLQFLDADDILESNKLELSLEQVPDIENAAKNHVVITNFKCFKTNLEDWQNSFCELNSQYFNYQDILYNWDGKFSIPIHCGFFCRELLEDFIFPKDLRAKEDWIMWLHVFRKDVQTKFIDRPLAFYRSHANSMSKNPELMNHNRVEAILYLQKIIPAEELIPFYQYIIRTKYRQVSTLQKSISNHRNSRSYRTKQKIGDIIRKFFQR